MLRQVVSSIDDLHRILTEERIELAAAIDVIRRTEKLAFTVVPARIEPR